MTQRLMNAAGDPVSLIAGTTAYVRVNPSVAGSADGRAVNLPVSFDTAAMTACIYDRNGALSRPTVTRGENGLSVINVEPHHTADMSIVGVSEITIELKAVLTAAIPNTQYKVGDTLGFRWSVYATPALK